MLTDTKKFLFFSPRTKRRNQGTPPHKQHIPQKRTGKRTNPILREELFFAHAPQKI